MNIKLFTHADLDGIGCAILAKLAFKNSNIDCINYGSVDEKIIEFINSKEYENYDYIYITDISVSEDVANIIENTNANFKLLDHHPTALFLNKYNWARVIIEDDVEKVSGTSLFYKELLSIDKIGKNECIKEFVENVKRYDTWLWRTKYNDITPKLWNDLFYILGKEKFIDIVINKIKNENKVYFGDFEKSILDIEQRRISEYIEYKNKNLIFKDILNKKVGVCFAESYISELGNSLCELHPELDFVAIINIEKGVSYRTIKDDIDLGKDIAKIYGGGGHPKSAGSEFDKDLLYEFLDKLFEIKE